MVHPSFNEYNRIQYSVYEETKDVEEIKNTRVRECMKMTGVTKGVEIHVLSEIPTRAGLGGSSSFTVGLLNALYAYRGKSVSAERLAEEACEIEIDILKEPIGKQDQYIAAYGGLCHIQFNQDDSVFVNPFILDKMVKKQLNDNLLLFFTGITRNASDILAKQKENIGREIEFGYLQKLSNLAQELKNCLNNNKQDMFVEILKQNWELKKKLAEGITNPIIDQYYQRALDLGASGGKILGAGGGGFLLLYCEPKKHEIVRKGLNDLKETPFKFVSEGSKIIHSQ